MSKSPPAKLFGVMTKAEASAVTESPPEILRPAATERVYQPPVREARDGLTIRVLQEDNQRLAKMSVFENRTKQSLLDQAIREFLDKSGY
jgi:hypothetical protein